VSAPAPAVPSGPAAWDSTPVRRSRRRVLPALTVLFLLPAVFATVLRLVGPTDDTWALVSSFVPYGQLGYPVALVLLLAMMVRSRHRGALALVTVVVTALTALHVSWVAPFFVADRRPVVGPELTLLSLNAYRGEVDVAQLTQAAADVDVVVLTETTSRFLRALQSPQWNQDFPYAVGDASGAPADTSVFSRYPLTQTSAYGHSDFTQWVTTVAVPGRAPVRLIAAHPCNPYCGNGLFAADHALLEGTVRANTGSPLVVAGDLNAIDDHGPLVRLRADGMRSATDLVGAGWVPTYPANHRVVPPLLPIDHVLVNDQLTATALRTIHLQGTDHLGLVVTLAGTR
jgi:endonuclease/exonuclease/phosphatase family metal-dependent hydrolase